MGPTIEALTRDFSWSVIEALRSYDAERTGVPCPASLLKNATQARQAFHGSVLRRRDGTYHIVDFTGGVKTSGDAICLMLKPLAGGPAKQFYPAELAQSVEWISMACLSNKSFSDTSDTPPLKQGGRAVAGIKLAGTQIDCRILWDETKHQIRLDTASGTVQELEGATPEQISKKTDFLGAPWDVARPEINHELLEGIRGRVVDVDDFLARHAAGGALSPGAWGLLGRLHVARLRDGRLAHAGSPGHGRAALGAHPGAPRHQGYQGHPQEGAHHHRVAAPGERHGGARRHLPVLRDPTPVGAARHPRARGVPRDRALLRRARRRRPGGH